jgi:Domain of unknown function (DUF4852)
MTRKIALLLFLLLFSTSAARAGSAGEAFVYPTYIELTQAVVMMAGGVDLARDDLVDDYIKLMYCDIYRENYRDDFAWHTVRNKLAEKIRSRRERFRALYQIGGVIELGRYDFAQQQFPLIKNTAFQNVGKMVLFSSYNFQKYCPIVDPDSQIEYKQDGLFPKDVNIILNEPINFTALRATPQEAEKLMAEIARDSVGSERKAYIRFRFRLQGIQRVQTSKSALLRTDFSGEIVSIDLFYDKEMTKFLARVPMR